MRLTDLSFAVPARQVTQARVGLVYWLTIAALGMWTVLRIAGIGAQGPPVQVAAFAMVWGLAAGNLGLRTLEVARRSKKQASGTNDTRRTTLTGWLFVSVDLTLVALGLRATGGASSPLWFVLFIVVTAETILASRREAQLIRYGAVVALVAGTLPLPAATLTGGYFLDTTLRGLALVAVSSIVRRLRENRDAERAELSRLRAEVAQATERANLSRELHDGVGNSLAAAVLRLEVAARTLEKGRTVEENLPELLRDEAASLRQSMTAVRDWSFFTRPWSGDAAAEIERLSRRTGMAVASHDLDGLARLSDGARVTVLRIVQEALTNCAKYAGAGAVRVSVEASNASVIVTVTDDGCGFDTATAGAGVGLASMRERAEGLGGTLRIESAAGAGTTVTLVVPTATLGVTT